MLELSSISGLEDALRGQGFLEGGADGLVADALLWGSEPDDEIEESLVKARPLLEAIGAPLREPVRL